jgi:hypothetical protein
MPKRLKLNNQSLRKIEFLDNLFIFSERDPNSALPPPVIGGFSPTVIGQVKSFTFTINHQ